MCHAFCFQVMTVVKCHSKKQVCWQFTINSKTPLCFRFFFFPFHLFGLFTCSNYPNHVHWIVKHCIWLIQLRYCLSVKNVTFRSLQTVSPVAQWVKLLTHNLWMPVSREFEVHQRLPLLPWARNFILIGKYWLVSGMDSSVIYISKNAHFTIQLK